MLNTENYQKKTQILQYENEKKIHIERIPDSDIFWQVNTTKVVYPQKNRKSSRPSSGVIYGYAEISVWQI